MFCKRIRDDHSFIHSLSLAEFKIMNNNCINNIYIYIYIYIIIKILLIIIINNNNNSNDDDNNNNVVNNNNNDDDNNNNNTQVNIWSGSKPFIGCPKT